MDNCLLSAFPVLSMPGDADGGMFIFCKYKTVPRSLAGAGIPYFLE